MLLGSALMFLFSILYLFVSDINAMMYALRLLQGVAFGLFFTSAATAVSYTIPRNIRHSCLTTFGITMIACFSIGPFFGEILIEKFGYHTFFLYASSCLRLYLASSLRRRPVACSGGRFSKDSSMFCFPTGSAYFF